MNPGVDHRLDVFERAFDIERLIAMELSCRGGENPFPSCLHGKTLLRIAKRYWEWTSGNKSTFSAKSTTAQNRLDLAII